MTGTINTVRHAYAIARSTLIPKTGMVLAAGLGRRMMPITRDIPKPLVEVRGTPLIDYAIRALTGVGVERIVVNVHYLADKLETHLSGVRDAEIVISDERDALMDSGGGVAKALDQLGGDPFFVLNADSFWMEGFRPNLERMAMQWASEEMDALLLMAGMANTVGYSGLGDFTMDPEGRLIRRKERHTAPFVYAGAGIAAPALFANPPQGPFSLNRLFDKAAEAGRLYGVRLDGLWFHVGTPESIQEAETAIAKSAA